MGIVLQKDRENQTWHAQAPVPKDKHNFPYLQYAVVFRSEIDPSRPFRQTFVHRQQSVVDVSCVCQGRARSEIESSKDAPDCKICTQCT